MSLDKFNRAAVSEFPVMNDGENHGLPGITAQASPEWVGRLQSYQPYQLGNDFEDWLAAKTVQYVLMPWGKPGTLELVIGRNAVSGDVFCLKMDTNKPLATFKNRESFHTLSARNAGADCYKLLPTDIFEGGHTIRLIQAQLLRAAMNL